MRDDSHMVQWAPRVRQSTIRRLYESDAAGRLDETLVDEVAYAFMARCKSIVTVTRAERGQVTCPQCGSIVERTGGRNKDEVLCCEPCGWQTTWGAYLKTYQRKQLSGGYAIGAFAEYIEALPKARTSVQRMLLIDWMIHQVHAPLVRDPESWRGRTAAVNLIEGNMTKVLALLTELAYGQGSTPQVRIDNERWRQETMLHLWGIERTLADKRRESPSRRWGSKGKRETSEDRTP